MRWLHHALRSPSALAVGVPAVRGGRVTARVGGRDAWFESADRRLAPAAEAFAAAFLVPALHAGLPLDVAAPVCADWAAAQPRLVATLRDLWYPSAVDTSALPEFRPRRADGRTTLCFSGGVDAFHALLTASRPIHELAYVVGYDVTLRQRSRATAVESLVRGVAADMGLDAVILRTNLRRHPLQRRTPWLRAFGGGLAAVGHLLAERTARLLVASDGLGYEHPEVGLRAGIDHLHGSSSVAIEHVAATTTRLEKIRAIAREPLVQRHLRVCWRNVGDGLNCGRCEKCVRTMLALAACGQLGRCRSFAGGAGLAAAVAALPAVDGVVGPFYADLLAAGLPPSLAAPVRDLVGRSPDATPVDRSGSPRRPASPPRRRLLDAAAFAPVCTPLLGRRVGYVRPHGNVGDALIEVAMLQLFAEYGVRCGLWREDRDDGFELLVFGGGGNMGTRYADNHSLRGRALASGLPLVILPQSFTGPEPRPFRQVYVRERKSLAFVPDATLAPDLALGLACAAAPPPRHGLGVFLRRDRERRGAKPLVPRDPARLCRVPSEYLALAADHERIVTDRLHFAIAGLHMGRDVTLVANDYHKNEAMHAAWLADLGCRFAPSAAEAIGRRTRAA